METFYYKNKYGFLSWVYFDIIDENSIKDVIEEIEVLGK